MILGVAARTAQLAPSGQSVKLSEALDGLADEQGRALRAITNERPTLVVLLRHSGCTFRKQTLSDLARRQGAIEKAGIGLVVVGMTESSEGLQALGRARGLDSASWVADPRRVLYRALELKRGTFLQLFGPRVWFAGHAAIVRGDGVGKLEGDGVQMSGAFVIHEGRVSRAYRHKTAAVRPDLEEFACPIQ